MAGIYVIFLLSLLIKTVSAVLYRQPLQGYKEKSSIEKTFGKSNQYGLPDFFVLLRL